MLSYFCNGQVVGRRFRDVLSPKEVPIRI